MRGIRRHGGGTIMAKKVELLAGYWTIAGDRYPMGPSEVSQFSFRERAEAAAAAGYTGMGLVYQDIMANAAKMGLRGMKKILDDNGIVHIEVEFLGDWFEEGAKKAASDTVRGDLLEAAAAFGARDLKIAPKMYEETIDIPRYAAALAEVCEHAGKVGTNVAIEVLPFTNIRDLKTAREVVRQAGHDNAGLCVDIWHIARGGISYDEVRALPASYIKSVELNDARAEVVGSLWDDTIHHRVLCGEGVFNPRAFIAAIRAAGFDDFYSVEVLSKEHRTLPLAEQARRSYDTTMAMFEPVAA